jgi:Uncharacterised protein family (UPF0158)
MNDEQPRRTVQVDLEELQFAMEDASFEHRYFLDTETGEVILVSELFDDDEAREQLARIDEAEPGRYLQVPHADSHEGYGDMQDFIATVRDEHLQELLEVAIQGPGAFRRFKDVLARHAAEQQRLFDFQAARSEARAREWLAEEGCEAASPRTRK